MRPVSPVSAAKKAIGTFLVYTAATSAPLAPYTNAVDSVLGRPISRLLQSVTDIPPLNTPLQASMIAGKCRIQSITTAGAGNLEMISTNGIVECAAANAGDAIDTAARAVRGFASEIGGNFDRQSRSFTGGRPLW